MSHDIHKHEHDCSCCETLEKVREWRRNRAQSLTAPSTDELDAILDASTFSGLINAVEELGKANARANSCEILLTNQKYMLEDLTEILETVREWAEEHDRLFPGQCGATVLGILDRSKSPKHPIQGERQ